MRTTLSQNKGSSLVFVMMTMLILSIIGLSLLSFTFSALKLSQLSGVNSKAFYINDAAMEEALAKLKEYGHQAEAYASKRIYEDKAYLSEPEWQDFLYAVNEKVSSGGLTEEEGIQKIQDALDLEFEKLYYSYLIEGFTLEADYNLVDVETENIDGVDVLKYTLTDHPSYQFSGLGFKPEFKTEVQTVRYQGSYAGAKIKSMTLDSQVHDNSLFIQLTSQGGMQPVDKKIFTSLEYVMPSYQLIAQNKTDNLEIHKNQLLDHMIATEGNILLMDGNIQIDGQVYAYGTYPEQKYNKFTDKNGISCGYSNAGYSFYDLNRYANDESTVLSALSAAGTPQITIGGDVATRGDLQVLTPNTHVTLLGNLFADGAGILKNSAQSTLDIKKNFYAYEDMVIQSANNAKITIGTAKGTDGEFWGMLDGDPASQVQNSFADRSSGIIIASRYGNEKVTLNSLYVRGTQYLSAYKNGTVDRLYYQTGESVTTANQAYFYEQTHFSEVGVFTSPYHQEGSSDTVDLVETNSAENDARFKADHFMTWALEYEGTPYAISDEDKSKVTLRNISGGTPSDEELNSFFTLGTLQANGYVFNPEKTGNLQAAALSLAADLIDSKTNFLGYRDYENNTNVKAIFDQMVNWSTSVSNVLDPMKDLIIVNRDPNRTIYMGLPEGDEGLADSLRAKGHIVLEGQSAYKGIIITEGDVLLYSKAGDTLSFKGHILSKGDVVIYGEGDKHLIQDEGYTIALLSKYQPLRSFFITDQGRKVDIIGNVIDYPLALSVQTNSELYDADLVDEITVEGINKLKTSQNFRIIEWRELQ